MSGKTSARVVNQESFLTSHRSMKISSSQKMTTKLYGKDLKEYDEMDIDQLLAKLTPEELEELNNEVDPDNSLLPPSQRCREQTTKEPTGPFKREQLLKYLEEKAKNEKDWDEKVPYEQGAKRGSIFKAKDEDKKLIMENGEMPIELDIDDEFAEALKLAEEPDLVDLAGILGMHSIISQVQYYNAVKGKPQSADHNTFTGIIKTTAHKLLPDEPPNDTDVDNCIERLGKNDASLTEININNMKTIPKEKIVNLIEAARSSKHLETFCMANTAVTDAEVRGLLDVVEENPSLKNLNVESNFLSGELLADLLRATLNKQTLVELHAENQRSAVLGNKIEMDITRSIEENETLLRVGISFQCMEARHRVSEALERNYEKNDDLNGSFSSGGGGFLASQTPAMERKSNVRGRQAQAAPVTVAMIQEMLPGQDHIRIGCQEFSCVTIVGVVRNVQRDGSAVFYNIDDMTAAPLFVRHYVETQDDDVPAMENTYVRIIGKLNSFEDKRSVMCHFIRPINDFNEQGHHLLEIKQTKLFYTKDVLGRRSERRMEDTSASAYGHGGMTGGVRGGTTEPQQQQLAKPGNNVSVHGRGTSPDQQIYLYLKQDRSEEGASIKQIFNQFRQLNPPQIRSYLDHLANEGQIYTTVDDEHFKVTD